MKGKIYSIEGRTVFLSPEQTGCFGCMTQEHCRKPQLIAVENRTGLELSPGQFVETTTAKQSLVRQTLLSLLPLFVGFTAGFALVAVFFPLSGDGTRGVAGVAGLFFAGFAVYALRKRSPDKSRPHIVRICAEIT
ncbi:MAG: SoxR reducing system RseC family protein [Treponema sp.]|jgi:positive regulator of sigma E activity|nr:SoxR reducing system RseC family protein [Treponema sp.]